MGPEPLLCVYVPLCWLHAPGAAPGTAVKERGKRDPLRAQVGSEVLAVSLFFFFLAGRHNKKIGRLILFIIELKSIKY